MERSWDYYCAAVAVCDAEERVMEAADELRAVEERVAYRTLAPLPILVGAQGEIIFRSDPRSGIQGEPIWWN
jgi:hypothetical protein